MSIIEDRLATIGFGAGARPDRGGWHVERLGAAGDDGTEPGIVPLRRHDWSLWLDRLRDRPGPLVYRIRRAF